MGIVRNLMFRSIYPLPQKGEDLLVYKEKFIDEYTWPYQLAMDIKMDLFSQLIRSNKKRKQYIKSCKDKEQYAHLEAYKTWRQITSHVR